jgi:hypothetical protein
LDKQATFADLSAFQYVRALNATQVDIIRFLELGDYQAHIARRLGKSRSYVNQVVRRLERAGLIVADRLSFAYQGKTHTAAPATALQSRATGYTITKKLKDLLAQNPHKDGTFTLCIPHHLKIKLPILEQTGEIATTGWHQSRARSVHIKSWQPRGHQRHLFHVDTVGGPIGVEYHGTSLVAYRVERTHLLAASVDEATNLAAAQIQDGISRFVEEQGWAGVRLTLGSPQVIDKPHFAFASAAAKRVLDAGPQPATPGVYVDNSLEKQGRPDAGEIETSDPILADQIDRGLRNAINIVPIVQQTVRHENVEQSKTLLDQICQQLDPIARLTGSISQTVNTVLAHVQGGTTLEYQFTQVVAALAKTIEEIRAVRNDVQDLKVRIERVEQGKAAPKPRQPQKKPDRPASQ